MPTTYTDQFFEIDPYAPPPVGTFLPVISLSMTDQNDDGDFDQFDGDSIDGSDITSSYPGDTVTVNVSGVGLVTYVGTTFYLADGRQVFTTTDGQVLQAGTLDSASYVTTQGPLEIEDLGPPCFTEGTLIETKYGQKKIETLKVGDLVLTLDSGYQPIRWIGSRSIAGRDKFAPIRFAKGAIGNTRALLVSPQHRMLIEGWRAEVFFGEDEVLVPAKHLINGDTIHRQPLRQVTYFHMLFDSHEIVVSEGCPSESFFPGEHILDEDRELQQEIFDLFPELKQILAEGRSETARMVINRSEAAVLREDLLH